MITKRGEFFPFGITVSHDGQVGLAAADPRFDERPDSLAVLDGLYAGISDDRETYRAVGFVADVTASCGDAVRVEAEHRDGGPPLVILMPYQRKGLVKKVVTYGQMAVSEGPGGSGQACNRHHHFVRRQQRVRQAPTYFLLGAPSPDSEKTFVRPPVPEPGRQLSLPDPEKACRAPGRRARQAAGYSWVTT